MSARPWAIRLLPALFALAILPGCLAARFAVEFSDRFAQFLEEGDAPEIDLHIRGPGDDSIEVYSEGSPTDRRRIAEGVAAWLGFPNALAYENEFYPDTTTVDLDTRLVEPGSGDEWILDIEGAGLMRVLMATGFDSAVLSVCTPHVETRVRSSRPPDFGFDETFCESDGRGWVILTSDIEPLTARVTLLPDAVYYLAYGAGVLLAMVVIGALAWWLGDKLRRGPFRSRSAAAVAIGLIGGSFAAIGLGVVAAGIGAGAGPADNLALARDLTIGGFVSSILFPALIASAPGIVFALMLVRKRPWPDEVVLPIGPGAPPQPPGPPAPPPLPWGG
jgi:hypothetical protein